MNEVNITLKWKVLISNGGPGIAQPDQGELVLVEKLKGTS